MEEINLKELFNFFWTKKFIIIIMAVISMLFGIFYVEYLEKPMYRSSTTVILVNARTKDATTSESTSDLNLNKQLVSTYSEIIKNSSVLEEVISKLELDMTSIELAKTIKVTSVDNTEIIKIEAINKDNLLAKNIVEQVTNTFTKKIKDIYNLDNVTVLSEAKIEIEPYNISLVKQTAIATIIGIVIGSGIVFLIFYFDTTVKTKNDIENKLNMLVLGTIAKVGDGNEV